MHQRGVAVPVPQVDARAAIQQQLDLGQAGETGPTAYVTARCSLAASVFFLTGAPWPRVEQSTREEWRAAASAGVAGSVAASATGAVEGYNNSKRMLGEDVTVAHGLWKSDAHKRYSRFSMGVVAQIPAAVSGVLRAEGGGAAEGAQPAARSASAPAERGPPVVQLTREALQGGGSAAATASGAVAAVDGRVESPPPANVVPEGGDEAGDVHTSIAEAEAASEADLLPDGWRLSEGGGYVGPDGRSALSRADAWREWDESSRADARRTATLSPTTSLMTTTARCRRLRLRLHAGPQGGLGLCHQCDGIVVFRVTEVRGASQVCVQRSCGTLCFQLGRLPRQLGECEFPQCVRLSRFH